MENGFENIDKDGCIYHLEGMGILYYAAAFSSITILFVMEAIKARLNIALAFELPPFNAVLSFFIPVINCVFN